MDPRILIRIYHAVQELWAFSLKKKLNQLKWCSAKLLRRFAYHWLDNVKKYGLVCKILSKYTIWLKIYGVVLDCIDPWSLHPYLLLWAFSPTDHGRSDWCSTKPCPSNTAVMHVNDYTMLTCIYNQNLIKIYHVVQKLWAFSLTDNGRTDSQSDYNTNLLVVQYKN